MNKKYLIISLLCIIIGSQQLAAQEAETITSEEDKFKLKFLQQREKEVKTNLAIWGRVEELEEGIVDANIKVIRGTREIQDIKSVEKGNFSLELDFGFIYTLVFSKTGYVTKKVEFDLETVPPEDRTVGYEYGPFEIKLFRWVPDIDFTIFEKPVGKVYYDSYTRYFKTDKPYYRKIQKKITPLEDAILDVLADREEDDYLLRDQYNIIIRDADIEYELKDYWLAKTFYNDALAIIPEEQYPKTQIAKIDSIINVLVNEMHLQYEGVIAKADSSFRMGDYQNARSGYGNAMNLKVGDKYAKDQINKIDNIIASQAAYEKQALNEAKLNSVDIDLKDVEINESFLGASAKLASKYPQGLTKESTKVGNKTISRYIVVDGRKAVEYKKVKHDWGGEYYFYNGQTTPRHQFKLQLAKFGIE